MTDYGKQLFELGMEMSRAQKDAMLGELNDGMPKVEDYPEVVWGHKRGATLNEVTLTGGPIGYKESALCYEFEDDARKARPHDEPFPLIFKDAIALSASRGIDWILVLDSTNTEIARYPTR